MGVGCRVRQDGDELAVIPRDGVRQRVRFLADRVRVETSSGEMARCAFDRRHGRLQLELEDTTASCESSD